MESLETQRKHTRKAPGPALGAVSDARRETIRRNLEELGLNGYEARVLLALLEVGSASAPDLARLAGIHRTSVYPVLQELSARGLAQPLPGPKPVWASPGRDEVLERLKAPQEEHLRALASRIDQTRELLTEVAPPVSGPLPYLHFIRGAAQTKATYNRFLKEATTEVLVCNRPPYSWTPGQTNRAVLAMLARKVAVRALYDAAGLQSPEAAAFRREHEGYMAAGVEARVVDRLPIKLVVVDRRIAMVAMADSNAPDAGYPDVLHIDNPSYAEAHAAIFEHYWSIGWPYQTDADTADEKPVTSSSLSPEGHRYVTRGMGRFPGHES